MMRTIALALLAMSSIAATIPSAQAGPNILVNGDFSAGSTGWTTWGSFGCSHSFNGGSYALVDSSSSHSCGIYQSVAVVPGTFYYGQVDVNVASGTVQLYLRWVDAFGNDVISNFPLDTSAGTGAQTLSASGTAPSGATHMRFWIYVTTTNPATLTADNAFFS